MQSKEKECIPFRDNELQKHQCNFIPVDNLISTKFGATIEPTFINFDQDLSKMDIPNPYQARTKSDVSLYNWVFNILISFYHGYN